MEFRPITQELYQRRKRRGVDTNPKPIILTDKQISRYKSRVIIGRPTDCWMFQAKSKDPYARFQGMLAHRIAYFLAKGAIPEGLTIDHLCCNRWCQNPNHLEAVTRLENSLRGKR